MFDVPSCLVLEVWLQRTFVAWFRLLLDTKPKEQRGAKELGWPFERGICRGRTI